MNYLEIAGVAVGLIYLWLEYRASAWLWIVGVIMPVIYLFIYWRAGLYADFGISIYYILASVYGLIVWLRRQHHSPQNLNPDDDSSLQISHTPRFLWLPLALICLALGVLLGYILATFTDSTVPWADGFTTSLSIVAMWMLAQKYLEQWIVWILADLGCAALYAYKDLWFTGGLYLLYSFIAIAGYRKWWILMHSHE